MVAMQRVGMFTQREILVGDGAFDVPHVKIDGREWIYPFRKETRWG